jgi:DNA primase catalytic core
LSLKDISDKLMQRSECFADVFSACRYLLKTSDHASAVRNYLADRITNNSESGFSFGYFPSDENLDQLIDIVPESVLIDLKLVYKKSINDSGHNRMVNHSIFSDHNLVMLYHNLYGDILGLVGRTVLPKEKYEYKNISKYKNSQLLKILNFFGLHKAKTHILSKNHVIVVEGQFDMISCFNNGFKNTVALGGSAFTKYHFNLLTRYTKNIYLVLDNDQKGKDSANKIYEKYHDKANIVIVNIPEKYKDIDEVLRTEGKFDLLNF